MTECPKCHRMVDELSIPEPGGACSKCLSFCSSPPACSASRDAFERWYADEYFDHPMPDDFDRFEGTNEGPDGEYRYGDVRLAWAAWRSDMAYVQN